MTSVATVPESHSTNFFMLDDLDEMGWLKWIPIRRAPEG